MKKVSMLLLSGIVGLLLSGCGGVSHGMQTRTISKPTVKMYYEQGRVISSTKVVLDSTTEGATTGAIGGAVVGALAGHAIKGNKTFIGATTGALIGGIAGGAMNDEKVSYETVIKHNNMEYVTYLDYELRPGTNVEFLLRDGEISNINVK